MSIADDQDFARALVKQTTELVGKSLVSVKADITADRNRLATLQTQVKSLTSENKELKEKIEALEENNVIKQQDSEIEQLKNRVKALEDQKSNSQKSTVTDQLTRAFTAAVAAINIHPGCGIPDMDDNFSAVSVCSPVTGFLSSTPNSAAKGTGMPVLSPNPNSFYLSQSKKRKTLAKTSTSTFITDLEQVDESLRENLRPFHLPNPRAANDLLNQLQRAFIKYQAKKLMDTGESITKALGKRVVQEGLTHQIWDSEFNPSDTESFEAYIINRLKNERRGLRNQAVLDTQNEMLSNYLATSNEVHDDIQTDLE